MRSGERKDTLQIGVSISSLDHAVEKTVPMGWGEESFTVEGRPIRVVPVGLELFEVGAVGFV